MLKHTPSQWESCITNRGRLIVILTCSTPKTLPPTKCTSQRITWHQTLSQCNRGILILYRLQRPQKMSTWNNNSLSNMQAKSSSKQKTIRQSKPNLSSFNSSSTKSNNFTQLNSRQDRWISKFSNSISNSMLQCLLDSWRAHEVRRGLMIACKEVWVTLVNNMVCLEEQTHRCSQICRFSWRACRASRKLKTQIQIKTSSINIWQVKDPNALYDKTHLGRNLIYL